jgi:hypothetical protein
MQIIGSICRSVDGKLPVSAGTHRAQSMPFGVWLAALQATWQE